MSDIGIDDHFITEISKDLDLDSEFESVSCNIEHQLEPLQSLPDDEDHDDENLDQHIPAPPQRRDSNSSNYFSGPTDDEKAELDARSIYVGNVDYGSTAKELEAHFHGCGAINKITILTDKFTGHPKGFAYIEFASIDSVDTAMLFDESEFRGRPLKVMPKRTNIPGLSSTNRPPMFRYGQGGRFGGRSRGGRGAGHYNRLSLVQNGTGAVPRTSHFRRRNYNSAAPY